MTQSKQLEFPLIHTFDDPYAMKIVTLLLDENRKRIEQNVDNAPPNFNEHCGMCETSSLCETIVNILAPDQF